MFEATTDGYSVILKRVDEWDPDYREGYEDALKPRDAAYLAARLLYLVAQCRVDV